MSAAALALSFFDPAHEIYGTARSGATILFEGRRPRAVPEAPVIEKTNGAVTARIEGELDLQVEPLSEPADLGEVAVSICQVRGAAAGRNVDCLGTLAETTSPPRWEELDALRAVSAIVDAEHALVLLARRPRGALGHGDERVSAMLIDEGSFKEVEEARLSTVYDGDARQRSAGLELWLPGEEFPRRGSGTVLAGTSLALGELEVHAAVFSWKLEGREGIGGYELTTRTEPPAAA